MTSKTSLCERGAAGACKDDHRRARPDGGRSADRVAHPAPGLPVAAALRQTAGFSIWKLARRAGPCAVQGSVARSKILAWRTGVCNASLHQRDALPLASSCCRDQGAAEAPSDFEMTGPGRLRGKTCRKQTHAGEALLEIGEKTGTSSVRGAKRDELGQGGGVRQVSRCRS